MRLLALFLAALSIGHSIDGRAIRPVVLGDPAAARRVRALRTLAAEGVSR